MSVIGDAESVPDREGLRYPVYNSVWGVRLDAWTSLDDAARRLADRAANGTVDGRRAQQVVDLLHRLDPIEHYWAYPGRHRFGTVHQLFDEGNWKALSALIAQISRALVTDSYRSPASRHSMSNDGGPDEESEVEDRSVDRPYFEVLIVDNVDPQHAEDDREALAALRRSDDEFLYEVVIVPSFEDALIATLVNFNLLACVVRQGFSVRASHDLSALAAFADGLDLDGLNECSPDELAHRLAGRISELRPEIALYLMTEAAVETIAGRVGGWFRRVFYSREGLLELHLSILRGTEERYRAPFFAALRAHSQRPTGVFHALPISRGASVVNSHWIKDMVRFYGLNIFLAETSATSGGLDSLLEPTGPLKEAQELAAATFGARQTFFVTNGTSTANKIVVQGLIRPGDIVLADRNCHKSHHYGLVLAGAHVAYLDAYPLREHLMYGAVPLERIKRTLLGYRRAGRLDQVRMLMLTNCTFDGIVYNVEQVMEECLAIKPDLVFLWDEAWFAFARFHPAYRPRTGMAAARRLFERFRDPGYAQEYARFQADLGPDPDDETLLNTRLLPDPETVRIRAYVTQSTHKTLSALRQGSMIHVFDQDFSSRSEQTFREAYMTHTSTSPNYQILASLDLARRQAELEGYDLVQGQVEFAMTLRDAVADHPLLREYLSFLGTPELIPAEYRTSDSSLPIRDGVNRMAQVWKTDEFVLDPSRATLHIGRLGIDGDTFKNHYLMDRYGVQVNKTSRNSVLFMTNIGTTRSAVAYLIEVLVNIVGECKARLEEMSPRERGAHERAVAALTGDLGPLPDFSAFHPRFRPGGADTSEGDVREAFFLAYDETLCEYLTPGDLRDHLRAGRDAVSASFVTPYPPGFPVLVPGQTIRADTLQFLENLDTREIHGYRATDGFRVFTESALATRGS